MDLDLDSFGAPAFLSMAETERANRFRFERDRHRYIAGRTALRLLLGSYLSQPPQSLSFTYGPAGKPSLPGIGFNLAHSGPSALIAFTPNQRVGVDIEESKPLDDIIDTARMAFSPAEFARWKSLRAEPDLFYRIWTRKEAYLKAIGEGIAQRLQQFEVAFEPGEAPRILKGAEGRWTLADVSREPGYIAALAVENSFETIECLTITADESGRISCSP